MARATDSLRRQLAITCYDIDTSSHLPAINGNWFFYVFNKVTEKNSIMFNLHLTSGSPTCESFDILFLCFFICFTPESW